MQLINLSDESPYRYLLDMFDVYETDLISGSNAFDIVKVRAILCYILYKKGFSIENIAKDFNRKVVDIKHLIEKAQHDVFLRDIADSFIVDNNIQVPFSRKVFHR